MNRPTQSREITSSSPRRRSPAGVGRRMKPGASAGPDLSWQPLYRIGGYAALVFVVLVLVPVALVFAAPLPPTQGRAVLEYIAANRAVYLVELVSFVGLAVPALLVFGALAVALSRVNKALAAVGGLFGIVSETIALALGSSPQSLHGGLVVLADSYAVAGTDAERAGLIAAAEALIAATNAVSWGGNPDRGRHPGVVAGDVAGLVRPGAGGGRPVRGGARRGQRGPPPVDRPRLPGLRPAAAAVVRLGRLEAPQDRGGQPCSRPVRRSGSVPLTPRTW